MQPRTHVETLDDLLEDIEPDSVLWAVDVDRQSMSFLQQGTCIAHTSVSTSAFGLGNAPGSKQTPLGWHRAVEIIGRDAPLGQRFVSREPAGKPLKDFTGGTGDFILSRIVILEGLIHGLNHNSRERYIYLHGTDQEEHLGTPCSHGCIRVKNKTLAQWIERLDSIQPYVWIGRILKASNQMFHGTPPLDK